MSAVADKARYFLEQTVPQLREWEEKGLFSKDEIRTIVRKRGDYEHRVVAPRSRPEDSVAYANYEAALGTLLSKRMKRLKIRYLKTKHLFFARPTLILARAVDRHPSNATLWKAYLTQCCNPINDRARSSDSGARPQQSTTKRWRKAMTRALRLLPLDAELWAMAGRQAASNGDWEAARSTFLRACRFCVHPGSEIVWLEFVRCEMQWLAQMDRKPVEDEKFSPAAGQDQIEDGIITFEDDFDDNDDIDQDQNYLDTVREGFGVSPGSDKCNIHDPSSAALSATPARSGAIPRSVFDAATRQPFFTPSIAADFLNTLASSRSNTASAEALCDELTLHVADQTLRQFPGHPTSCLLMARQPVAGLNPSCGKFARGLRVALPLLWRGLAETTDQSAFAEASIWWLDEYLADGQLDTDIRTVLEDARRKLTRLVIHATIS